jgi:hypothetical protein
MEVCTEGRRQRLRENFRLVNTNNKAQDDRGSGPDHPFSLPVRRGLTVTRIAL